MSEEVRHHHFCFKMVSKFTGRWTQKNYCHPQMHPSSSAFIGHTYDCIWLQFSLVVPLMVPVTYIYVYITIGSHFFYTLDLHNCVYLFQATQVLLGSYYSLVYDKLHTLIKYANITINPNQSKNNFVKSLVVHAANHRLADIPARTRSH